MAEARRWLILVHQLPAHPSNLRVRVWRRLQQVGAVVLRNSLYVLPATDEAREDFNWVREEIQAAGGQVSVLEAAAIDGVTDGELVQEFRRQRTGDYEELAADIRKTSQMLSSKSRRRSPAARERVLRALRERLTAIQSHDYFGAAGRAVVEQAFRELDVAAAPRVSHAKKLLIADFQRRTWVARARPGIDRFACAWFIRRFIDDKARFAFAASSVGLRPREIPFDMADVEFGHHGTHCSLETFMERFAIRDPALLQVSRVVHDLDLKEARFGMPEGAAVARLVDGLRAAYTDDRELLEQGIVMIDALYRSFASEAKSVGKRR